MSVVKRHRWIALAALFLLFRGHLYAPGSKSKIDQEFIVSASETELIEEQDLDETERILRLNSQGIALMEQLRFEDASAKFAQILQIDEKFVPGYVNIGIARFNLQEYEDALKFLEKALLIDPDQVHVRYVRGLIYRNQDRPEMSIREFKAVLRQDPDDPSTNYFLGLLSSRQKKYHEAVRYLDQVIKKEPYNASAHYNLGLAFLRSGRRPEGEEEMREFRRLQGLFGSTTIGLQYLEQGRYSVAIDNIPAKYLPEVESQLEEEQVEVQFTKVEISASLSSQLARPEGQRVTRSKKGLQNHLGPFHDSGMSFVDYDNDGWLDIFVASTGLNNSGSTLFKNRGDGTFAEITSEIGIDYSGKTVAAVWGDFDNDASPDLYLVNYGPNVLYHNNQDGTFSDVTQLAGVGDSAWGSNASWVDFDHDGDLDIFVANFSDSTFQHAYNISFWEDIPGAENTLYRNNGDGTFSNVTAVAGVGGGRLKTVGVVCTDFDNSRDVDFYVVNLEAPNQLFSNLRNGKFTDVSSQANAMGPDLGVGLGVGDINRDGFVDLLLPSLKSSETSLLINQGNGSYRSSPLSLPDNARHLYHAEVFDFDNDGDQDVLFVAAPVFEKLNPGDAEFQNFHLFENRQGQLHKSSRLTGLDQFKSLPLGGVSSGDFDNDGDLDLVCNVRGSSPLLLRNDGGNQNNWVQIKLVATNSNSAGIGTKIELKSGRLYQKLEVYGGFGLLGHTPPRVHFGLGKKERVDMVRLLWPGGVLQSEIDQPINQRTEIRELDRKGTSCPILYLWDGTTYRFQTDFLGGGAAGSLLKPGIFNYPDTDEYIKLNRDDLKLRDGNVAITLNNQLEEVIFFDQLELVVIDHPSDYEIYPDEKLLPGPPYGSFRLFTIPQTLPLTAAWDQKGSSILGELSKIDRIYPRLPKNLRFKGYSELHEIVLDLGPVPSVGTILLAYAWIDYADSTSNLAAHQAGQRLIPPYLQVLDQQGRWVTVLENMGFPAGMPKTMTVDLSEKFLSDSRKVRIVTNMRIHWDRIIAGIQEDRSDYSLVRLSPNSADLHFHGFPTFFTPDGRQPKIYRYKPAASSAPWKVHIGGYTRYGDVKPLLAETDDMFVIVRSGDEIEVFFEVDRLPSVSPGWTRDYLVYVDGFGKDMDVNSASPDYVGPLPFHGMSAYPYPEGEYFPMDTKHSEYLRQWNTRIEEDWIPDISSD